VGYLNHRRGDKTWVEVDPDKARWVQLAYELAAEGKLSLRKIAEVVADLGLTSRNGKPLGVSALWGVLTNRFYLGELMYRGEQLKGNHEALVTHETWKKTQEQLIKRRRRDP
jgi:site-specific DNA recombinase